MATPPLSVQSNDDDAVLHIRIAGELDLATAPLLADRLTRLLDGGGPPPRFVEVDLADVGFCDHTGLRPVLHAQALVTGQGGLFSVRAASAAVRRLVDLLELADRVLVTAAPEGTG